MSLVSNRRLVSFRKVKLTSFYNKLRINTLNLYNIFVDTWDWQQLFLRSSRTFRFHGRCLSYPYVFSVICRSNRSFNIPPGTPPPHGHLTFLKMSVQIHPYPGQNAVQMLEYIQEIKCPHPGTFHRHINYRGTTETPSVVEQNLYNYSHDTAI